jgi:LysR family transcriptional regulator, chromosome initiation inhibitor
MSLLSPELTAFMAILKNGTVHGAARDIGLTQTGVTQRIRNLEKKVGATLFIRSRKGMKVTEEGKNLVIYCRKIIDIENETFSSISGQQNTKELRIQIVGSSSIMRSRIIPSSIKITKKFNNILFTYKINDDSPAIHLLKTTECQFAIASSSTVSKEMASKKLEPEMYILVVPYAWKDRETKEILKNERLIDFSYGDKTTEEFLRKYRLSNIVKKEGHYVNNVDATLAMVIRKNGYSILSKRIVEYYIEKKRLVQKMPDSYVKREISLAWYPRREMPKYFKTIVDSIN